MKEAPLKITGGLKKYTNWLKKNDGFIEDIGGFKENTCGFREQMQRLNKRLHMLDLKKTLVDLSKTLFNLKKTLQLGQLIMYPQKGITICHCLTYQAFKDREGIVSQTNLAEWYKIWHLWVETNKNMDDL